MAKPTLRRLKEFARLRAGAFKIVSLIDRPWLVQFLEGHSEFYMPPVPRLLNTITGGSPVPVYYLESGEFVVSH